MTKEEFTNQMQRVSSVYGDKYFPEERMAAFWKKLKFTPVELFTKVVTAIIAECATAPMLNKFVETKRMFGDDASARADEIEKRRENAGECSWCGKYGMVLAKSLSDGNEFAFKCSCTMGQFLDYSYPTWSIFCEAKFKLEPAPTWLPKVEPKLIVSEVMSSIKSLNNINN